ncbi:MAG: hypothetical protein HKL98_07990 [Burkholderiales bacterium]|nr:hypothetical protein [Burkholderiales bacterium]
MLIPDPIFQPLREFIDSRTGLHFEKRQDLERAVAQAAGRLGFGNAAECANWLISTPQGPQTIAILAEHLTVGETYFFRDGRLFEALEKKVLPGYAARGNSIRIWSAGCCTGEEAYSLAILTHRMGIPAQILASDIHAGFLEKAKLGVYGEWSFRECPAWVREGYFTRKNKGYRIDERIAERVNFFLHNLATDPCPAGVDLVFCRNVMMYFSERNAKLLAEKLGSAMAEDGLLVVSPVEASDHLFEGFLRMEIEGALFYGKKPIAPPVLFEKDPVMAEPGKMQEEVPDPARMAMRFADRGELEEAEKWCRMALASDGMDARMHYLLSRVLHEKHEFAREEEELEKVLYLLPDFIPAHVALGYLRKNDGRNPDGCFSSALALLSRLSRDSVLPDSGGMSAGRMAEMVRVARG